MQNTWKVIDEWLERNAPRVQNDLLPGASKAEINTTETQIELLLPEDFKTSVLIHNGQDGRFRLVEPWELIPIDGIASETERMNTIFNNPDDPEIETRGAVKPILWSRSWIPFAADGAGNLLCLDLDPAEGGETGQVILWASDPPCVEVIAPSYRAWLKKFAFDLEAGKYKWGAENEEWSRVTDET
jgi:cell wall assembly regulator SMI1